MDNISTLTGAAAFAYIDDSAWHGLGSNILKLMRETPADQRIALARHHAQLDYTVETRDIFLADGTKLADHKATVRVDVHQQQTLHADGSFSGRVETPLSVVGKGYQTIQNVEATDIGEALVRNWGAVPATAAALGNGERAFMLFRLADATISPVPGDDVRGYALLHWSHDGQTGVNLLPTAVRVVCQNTLSLALGKAKGKAWIKVKHTASAAERLDQAAKLMDKVMAAMKATGDTFATMAQKRLTPAQVLAYVAQVIPNTTDSTTVAPVIEARRATIAALVHGGKGAAMANQAVNTADGGASLWACYNAVTEYFDHVRPAEASSDAGRNNAYQSAIFGGNADIKTGALLTAQGLLAA